MDNKKRFFLAAMCSMAVLYIWTLALSWYLKAHPQPTQATTYPATTSVASGNSASNPSSTVPATTTTGAVAESGGIAASTVPAGAGLQPHGGPATQAVIGSDALDIKKTGPFSLGLDLTSKGAGIDLVTVNEFRRVVGKDDPYTYQEPDVVTGVPVLATETLVIDGVSVDVGSMNWTLVDVKTDETSFPATSTATFTLTISDAAGKPLLDVSKTISVEGRFAARDKLALPEGYEVPVSYSLSNRSDHAIKVRTVFGGPTNILSENARDYVQIVGAYNASQEVSASPHPVSGFKNDVVDLITDSKQPLLWSGISGAYFDALVRNVARSAPQAQPAPTVVLESVKAQATNPETDVKDRDVALAYETKDMDIPPAASAEFSLTAYFGPKARTVLKNTYYHAFPLNYDTTLVLVNTSSWFSRMCGYCTFQWLVNVLFVMLSWIHAVVRDWGLAIIGLVLIVRGLLHPITKKSQMNMMRMQKMGPEIERLKKKYGDDKDELNKAMMSVYKEQGLAPVLGCLPMFLQMPIWIALWNALQSTFELWHAPFLWGFTWIKDLSKPDALYTFAHPISIYFIHIDSINVLPILMVIVTYMNQKYMPKPVTTTPDQANQQKMMQWMSMVFPLMFYTLPSGLNLYYVTSMGLGIIESKRIREHIKQREEAEKAERVLVDAKPTRAGRRLAKDAKDEAEAPKRRGLAGWLADLQRRADEVRQSDKNRKRP